MKKILVFAIAVMFLIVACGDEKPSSKDGENQDTSANEAALDEDNAQPTEEEVVDETVVEDQCPDNEDKTEPGECGCDELDIDADKDGVVDCIDECPEDSAKAVEGICGCGTADVDTDEDGTMDCEDLCPEDVNKIEAGNCGCGTPEDGCAMFRLKELKLADPKINVACVNVTGKANDEGNKALNLRDEEDESILLNNLIFVFKEYDQASNDSMEIDVVGNADCSGVDEISCVYGEGVVMETTYQNMQEGICFEPNADVVKSSHIDDINTPEAQCYQTDIRESFTIMLGEIELILEDIQFAATYDKNAAGSLINGVAVGFLSKEIAETLLIPEGTPVAGGKKVSEILPGGGMTCPILGDKIDEKDSVEGWWVHLNYIAEKVNFGE